MITQAQLTLLETIKASLFGVAPNYPDDPNWGEVLVEAREQAVVGLISSVIPVSDGSVEQMRVAYVRILYEQNRLVKLLDSACIPCVILKGSAASIYYPKPYLRTMGDIDVLVPRDKFYSAIDLLESNGFLYANHGKTSDGKIPDNVREISYTINGVEVEIHHHFSTPGYDIDDVLEEAITHREYQDINGYRFPMLSEIENGLVLIGHINQHLQNNYLGIRQILDWEMYLHSIKDTLSWEKEFIPVVDKVGLLSIVSYVTHMCNKYLGLPERFSFCDEVDDELTRELLEIIMNDGNFGRREVSDTSRDEKRIRSAFFNIKRYGFYKYFTDVGLGTWKIGNKHPILKPLAFLYGVLRQLMVGIRIIDKNTNVSKQINEANKRYELYKKLGVSTGEDYS